MSNFKKKIDPSSGEGFKFENQGDKLTGFYIGSFPYQGNFAPTTKHLFKTEKGLVVVFGQKHLTSLLEGETPGVLMQVTFTGFKPSKKKGYAPMKTYELGIDATQRMDDSELVAVAVVSLEGEEEDFGNDDDQLDEVKTQPARSMPAAQAPSRDKVNAVLAKLNSRKAL